MINRYPGRCAYCGGHVAAKAGTLLAGRTPGRRRVRAWAVAHLACSSARGPAVTTVTFASGETITRNVRGLCEDAPCCGCCTF